MNALKNRLRLAGLTLTCLAILAFASSGCDLTIGPKTKTVYTIVHPGKPLQLVDGPVKVKGRLLNGSGDAVEQDIGGWVAMPIDHWECVQRALGQSMGIKAADDK